MSILGYLIPIALFLGGLSLAAFLWALRSGQYEDLDGAAERIFLDDDKPSPPGSYKS
ncbi:MAG: cbb3-type cytochrome oxidase assembly protein CcoS [Rhizobiaceae bacterium]|nr:cbb3-type cytochrome oxidase assembly protein CcoS [Rhizobiaceae bacterium]